MHQLIRILKFGRDLDFIRRDIWTKVWLYVRSAEQILSTAVARQIWKLTWWDGVEENYTGNEESVDANFSNFTASTKKNTQDNNMDIKDLKTKDWRPHSVAESDGLQDVVR